jgi:hypothetical protein
MLNKYSLPVFFLLLITSFSGTFAQSHSGGPGLIYVYGGLNMANVNTSAYFDITNPLIPSSVKTTLDLEDDVAFPSKSNLMYAKVIAGGRLQFVGTFFSLHRTGEKHITESFAFGDSVYSVGALVKGVFNTDYYSGTLRVSIIKNPIVTAGLSIGARYLKMDAGIDAQSYGYSYVAAKKFNIPLIVPGVHASAYALPGLLVRGSLEYFSLKISGTKGKVVDAQLSAEYYFLKYLGAGVAYNLLDITAEGLPDNSLYLRDVKYSVKGITLFAAFRF